MHNYNNGQPPTQVNTVDEALTRIMNTINNKKTKDDGAETPYSP